MSISIKGTAACVLPLETVQSVSLCVVGNKCNEQFHEECTQKLQVGPEKWKPVFTFDPICALLNPVNYPKQYFSMCSISFDNCKQDQKLYLLKTRPNAKHEVLTINV